MSEETDLSKTIQLICAALSRYYKSLGKNYNKLFSIYCNDHGLDDVTLLEELEQGDPEYLSVIDFDEEFPFKKEPKNRPQAIFDIIRKCNDNPNITFVSILQFDQDLFQIEPNALQEIKELYEKQCPALWTTEMGSDGGFLQMLAIGRKNKIDYMQHLVDDYSRDRIKHMNEINGWTPNDWSSNHKHFRQLNKVIVQIPTEEKTKTTNISHKTLSTGAVISFGSRCVAQLMFKNISKIDESLEMTVTLLNAAINFISNLVQSPKTICPFQIDLSISVGVAKIIENIVGDDIKSDCDNDNENDDDDDDDDDTFDETKSEVDYIGNIQEKLEKNKLKYKLSEQDLTKARMFENIYNNFVSENNLEEKLDEKSDYLHKKRLIVFIDRRKGKISDEKSIIYMYEPPKKCGIIPDDVVPEWSISSSRECILPSMNDNKLAIGANSHCKGSLLTFSFYVKMIDVIKCYMYWNGQVIRFMPQDIKTVFPTFFNMEYGGNQDYIDKNKDLDGMIKEMKKKLVDKEFTAFQESYA